MTAQLFEYRRQIQSQHRQLDGHQHHQRALCPRRSHGSVDRQRNDRLGRTCRQRFEHRREIQSQHRQLDSHQHHQRARCPIAAHGSLDRQRNDRLGRTTMAQLLNTGGRYNPSTDSWTATSTTNAPAARGVHTAVWTGSEMIVWGGSDNARLFEHRREIQSQHGQLDSHQHHQRARCPNRSHSSLDRQRNDRLGRMTTAFLLLNTGGRYNPGTDSWTATSTTNAPAAPSAATRQCGLAAK